MNTGFPPPRAFACVRSAARARPWKTLHRSSSLNAAQKLSKRLEPPLRAEFSGATIRVLLDGKRYIELNDDHIAGPGAVGVWTKADSVTAFDDFLFGISTGGN